MVRNFLFKYVLRVFRRKIANDRAQKPLFSRAAPFVKVGAACSENAFLMRAFCMRFIR